MTGSSDQGVQSSEDRMLSSMARGVGASDPVAASQWGGGRSLGGDWLSAAAAAPRDPHYSQHWGKQSICLRGSSHQLSLMLRENPPAAIWENAILRLVSQGDTSACHALQSKHPSVLGFMSLPLVTAGSPSQVWPILVLPTANCSGSFVASPSPVKAAAALAPVTPPPALPLPALDGLEIWVLLRLQGEENKTENKKEKTRG